MKCEYCANYMRGISECKFCHFEYDEYYVSDDWDILNLDDDYEWSHLQILTRIHAKGLPCLFADIWSDDNIAWLVGCNVFTDKIADVLGIHSDCVYNQGDQSFIVINLLLEKCIRKLEDEELKDKNERNEELIDVLNELIYGKNLEEWEVYND